jgi:CheY-like chemotaxis protein
MVRNVMFVDDDQEMLQALREGLDKYRETFRVLLAEDGLHAVEQLRQNTVSVVVTDLKMPRMDGFTLLAHIMENYPDIPVIIITGYSTPEMKRLAQEGGAVGYISKPFLIEDLARQIMKTLRKESEGGTLHSVSSGIFLQLMEMEERTCTIRLRDKVSGQGGVLFFRCGELLEARVGEQQGIEAAYTIFSWENVTLAIQNDCPQKDNRINCDLQPIILEAARRKDELEAPGGISEDTQDDIDISAVAQLEIEEPSLMDSIKARLRMEVGERSGLEDIYSGNTFDYLLAPFAAMGGVFGLGVLKLGYIDQGDANDIILVPSNPSTLISVNPKCPRDKIIQVLRGCL